MKQPPRIHRTASFIRGELAKAILGIAALAGFAAAGLLSVGCVLAIEAMHPLWPWPATEQDAPVTLFAATFFQWFLMLFAPSAILAIFSAFIPLCALFHNLTGFLAIQVVIVFSLDLAMRAISLSFNADSINEAARLLASLAFLQIPFVFRKVLRNTAFLKRIDKGKPAIFQVFPTLKSYVREIHG